MKILVAMDSFKGSLSAFEACNSVEQGIKEVNPDIEVVKRPVADGGEGTVETLIDALNGERIALEIKDPLMREIDGIYGIFNEETAVIESAISCGLTLLSEKEKNPLLTTTYGVGEIIKDALDKGVRDFIIGIGGSCTNDAGIGMLSVLGMKFFDKDDNLLEPIGISLNLIERIDMTNFDERIKKSKFLIASDVNNPLFGPNGAAYVYSPQKGANEAMVKELDQGLQHFSKIVIELLDTDYSQSPGAGAAGGLGYTFLTFFKSQLKPGVDIIFEKLELDKLASESNYIFTGEGKIDRQSAMGKVLSGIGALGTKYKIPVIAIAGVVDESANKLHKIGITSMFSIINKPIEHYEAINKENSKTMLKNCVIEIVKLLNFDN